MAKQITTTVTILGKDQLSPVVARAAGKSITHLESLNKRASALSAGAFGVARATAGMGTAIAAPLIYGAKQAVDFEHALAGLGKVAQMDLGSKGLTALGEQAKEIAPYLATMPGDIAKSMTALKQSGLGVSELKDAAKFVGEAGVAFDLTAAQAGQAFGTIKAAMGLTVKETKGAFDVINTLSNQMNATPERLISFFTAGGAGVANALKLESNEIAAYGATLIQAGKSGEEAATIMERVAKNIFAKDLLRGIYEKGGGGSEGILNVLKTGAALKNERSIQKYFAQFGEYGLEVRRLAQGMSGPGGLGTAMGYVATEQKYAGAVNAEFTSQMKSTLNQIKREWVALQVTVIDFGTQALPVIKGLLSDIKPVIAEVGTWIKRNPELTGTLIKAAAGLAAFSFATSALSAVVGAGATVVKAYTAVLGWFEVGGALAGPLAGLKALTAGMWAAVAPGLALAAPYIAAGIAVAGLGYAAYKAYQYFEPFHALVIRVTTAVQTLIDQTGRMFKAIGDGDWTKALDIMSGKAAQKQYDINVKAHMDEYRKNHPNNDNPKITAARVEQIKDNRRNTGPDFIQKAENARKLREEARMRRLLNPQNLPNKPYYDPNALVASAAPAQGKPRTERNPFDWTNPLGAQRTANADGTQTVAPLLGAARREVPQQPQPNYNGGTSISLTNNPIFNINGGQLTPEAKKDIMSLMETDRYKIMEMLKDAQRPMDRVKFDK